MGKVEYENINSRKWSMFVRSCEICRQNQKEQGGINNRQRLVSSSKTKTKQNIGCITTTKICLVELCPRYGKWHERTEQRRSKLILWWTGFMSVQLTKMEAKIVFHNVFWAEVELLGQKRVFFYSQRGGDYWKINK